MKILKNCKKYFSQNFADYISLRKNPRLLRFSFFPKNSVSEKNQSISQFFSQPHKQRSMMLLNPGNAFMLRRFCSSEGCT